MEETIVKTAESIAKEKLATMAKQREDKQAKAPADGKAPVEKPKVEEPKDKKEVVAEDKTKVATPEPEDKLNKRFGELTGKIKDLERKDTERASEIERLRKEKEELEAKVAPKETPEDSIKKIEAERFNKYLAEDKEKPKQERREMTDEEWSEWALEDYTAANRWLARNEARRERERDRDLEGVQNMKKAKELLARQQPYLKQSLVKHPELDTAKRTVELQAQGKSQSEIFQILCNEIPKYKLASEIIKEKPEFLYKENGPELVMLEMEKRLNGKSELKPKGEDVDAKIKALEEKHAAEKAELEAELRRRESIDSEVKSSRPGDAPTRKLSEKEAMEEKIRAKAGISREKLDAIKARRRTIAGQGKKSEDDN